MLHEAYYPSELSEKQPVKLIYGFVQENPNLTLVAFYPKLTGTATFNLSDETKAGLIHFLLTRHIYDVKDEFIRVVFVGTPDNGNLYSQEYKVNVGNAYFNELADKRFMNRSKTLLGLIKNQFIKTEKMEVNTRNFSIGSTSYLHISEPSYPNNDRTLELMNKLKDTNFGEWDYFFNANNRIAKYNNAG